MGAGVAGRVVVRRAEPGPDTAALAGLRWAWAVEKSATDSVPGVVDPARPDPDFVTTFGAWVAANTASHTAFLAVDGDRPVGMAWLAVLERVPDVDRPVRRAGYVQSVFVPPDCRDAGVGALLVAALLDEARARSLDYLVVSPSPRSRPFYARQGFTGADKTLLTRPLP